eukprot:4539291-Pleurochrysis_carterae.AAC.1
MEGQISDCRAPIERERSGRIYVCLQRGRMCSQAIRSAPPAVARLVLTMLRLGAAAIFLRKYSATLEIVYLRPLRCTK